VIGKYLSPDLYVSYGLGLFEPVSTVRLEYTLDENWKLSTESSTFSSGGDIIYTIER
jgi:translocation and assembly module TamB